MHDFSVIFPHFRRIFLTEIWFDWIKFHLYLHLYSRFSVFSFQFAVRSSQLIFRSIFLISTFFNKFLTPQTAFPSCSTRLISLLSVHFAQFAFVCLPQHPRRNCAVECIFTAFHCGEVDFGRFSEAYQSFSSIG